MKTYSLKSEQGDNIGFEINNNFISSGAIARYLNRVSGCEVSTIRKLFEKSEIHVVFKFKDVEFFVWETYGDSSRLIIGSESNVKTDIVNNLKNEFSLTKGYFFL
jgi:N-acetylmuramoyl-L-alanine amidase CwlA